VGEAHAPPRSGTARSSMTSSSAPVRSGKCSGLRHPHDGDPTAALQRMPRTEVVLLCRAVTAAGAARIHGCAPTEARRHLQPARLAQVLSFRPPRVTCYAGRQRRAPALLSQPVSPVALEEQAADTKSLGVVGAHRQALRALGCADSPPFGDLPAPDRSHLTSRAGAEGAPSTSHRARSVRVRSGGGGGARELGRLELPLHVTACQQLVDHVRRASLVADLDDRDDVRMSAQATSRSRRVSWARKTRFFPPSPRKRRTTERVITIGR
jgi:hypothetical protein